MSAVIQVYRHTDGRILAECGDRFSSFSRPATPDEAWKFVADERRVIVEPVTVAPVAAGEPVGIEFIEAIEAARGPQEPHAEPDPAHMRRGPGRPPKSRPGGAE